MSVIYVKGTESIPTYDTETLSSIDLTSKSKDKQYFYAEKNTNASLVLSDATHIQLKDGVTRYLTIKNTHATDTIFITLPTEKITKSSVISIVPQTQVIIKFQWDNIQSLWYIYWDKSIPILLQQSTTVNIPYGLTAAEIQAIIDSYPKNLNGYTLTFQFADCLYKYFNGTTDQIVGDGTTATVTHTGHGFSTNDVISINAEYNVLNFDGDYTITVIDENTYTFASSVVGTLVPTSSAIARKGYDLGSSSISIINFINGTLYVNGNTTETGYNTKHTTQRVYFVSTGNNCILIAYNTCYIVINNIKCKSVQCPTYQRQNKEVLQRYCFNINNSALNSARSSFGFYMCQAANTYRCIGGSYYGSARGATIGAYLSNVLSDDNDTYNSTSQYGLYSDSSQIYKSGTQPTGTIANEGKTNGGQIW